MKFENGRLHCENGPALFWPESGESEFFWYGIYLPDGLGSSPQIRLEDILHEENLEVRRSLIERYGKRRFEVETQAQILHRDDIGILYRWGFQGREPRTFVLVKNSTPALDGSFTEYFLRVPPGIRTVRQAVAWTFGMRANEYRPVRET